MKVGISYDMAETQRTLRQRADTRDNWREARRSPFDSPPTLSGYEATPDPRPLREWVREYFPAVFGLPFSPDHIHALDTIEDAIDHGGNYALAMPRGSGKSSMVKAACVWALVTGRRRSIEAVAAKGDLAREILAFVLSAVLDNEAIAADYPILCALLRQSEGKPAKAPGVCYPSADEPGAYVSAGIVCKAAALVLPYLPGAVWSEAGLQIDGITSSIRGKTRTLRNGQPLRPDFAFLDDLQTRESAESVAASNRIERLVTGDVLALAGPGHRLACVATCTIVGRDDLASRLTNRELHPEWQGTRAQTVTSWPAWSEGWDTYVALRKLDILDKTDKAGEYYHANRARLHEGAELAWPENHLPDSTALRDVYDRIVDMGRPAYLAEYQNAPLALVLQPYQLTMGDIIGKANGLPRRVVPATCLTTVLMCDINHTGLHWAWCGFAGDGSCHIADYGKWPEHEPLYDPAAPQETEEVAIFRGLASFRDHLEALAIRPDIATIDVGNWTTTVEQYLAANASLWPCRLFGSRGRANIQFRPPKDNEGVREHLYMSRYRSGQLVITHDACQLRERMQRAWLLPAGAPGAITIYGEPGQHTTLAEHILAETLAETRETARGTEYIWQRTKGPNDLGDALTGCYALAEVRGVGGLDMRLAGPDRPAAPPPPKPPTPRKRGRGLVKL